MTLALKDDFEGGKILAFIKALIVSFAVSAVWYGFEWMQFKELQWNRECDEVVFFLYFVILWYLFAHQR